MSYEFVKIEDGKILYYNKDLHDILNKYDNFLEFGFSSLDINTMKKLGIIVDTDEIIKKFLRVVKNIDINHLEKMFNLTNDENLKKEISKKILKNDKYSRLDNENFIFKIWKYVDEDEVLDYVKLLVNYKIVISDKDFVNKILKKASINNNKLFHKYILEKLNDGFIFKKSDGKITYISKYLNDMLQKYDDFIKFPIDDFKDFKKNTKKLNNLGIYWDSIYIIGKLLEKNPKLEDMMNIAEIINREYNKILERLREIEDEEKKENNYRRKVYIESIISKYISKLKKLNKKLDLDNLELDNKNPIKNILEFCKHSNNLDKIRDILLINNKPLTNYSLIKYEKIESLSIDIEPLPSKIKEKLKKILDEDGIKKLVPNVDDNRIYQELIEFINKNNNFKIDDLVFILNYEKKNFIKIDINKSICCKIKEKAPLYSEDYLFINDKDIFPILIINSHEQVKELLRKLNTNEFKINNVILFSKYPVFNEEGNIYYLKDSLNNDEALELIEVLIKNKNHYIEFSKNEKIKEYYLKKLIELFEQFPQELDFKKEYIKEFIKLCYNYSKEIKQFYGKSWEDILRKSLCITSKLIEEYYVDYENYCKNLSLKSINGKLIITKEEWDNLVESFKSIGIQKTEINNLFEHLDEKDIYFQLITKLKSNGNLNEHDFEFLIKNDERFENELFNILKSNAPYYIPKYSEKYKFLKNIDDYLPEILINSKEGFIKYINNCNNDVRINGKSMILKEPELIKIEDTGKLCIYHLRECLNDEEKKQLMDFIYNKLQEDTSKDYCRFKIYIDGKELDFKKIFGFCPDEKIYPNKYALNNEKVPDWLSEWIDEDSKKQEFLFKLFKLNTDYSPVVKLRKYIIGEEKIDKDKIKLSNLNKKHILNTILWLKENKNRIIKWERVKKLYSWVKDEILDKYVNKEIFLASKFNENGKKEYDFKQLNELLYADNKLYYEKFKDKIWILECKCFKDKVELLSKRIKKEFSNEELLKKAKELDENKYIGYKKLKEILKKDLNLKFHVYIVGKKLQYKLILNYNDKELPYSNCNTEDFPTVEIEENCYLEKDDNLVKVYISREDSGIISKALEDENILNDKKYYYNLIREIIFENDKKFVEDKIIEILNIKIDDESSEEEEEEEDYYEDYEISLDGDKIGEELKEQFHYDKKFVDVDYDEELDDGNVKAEDFLLENTLNGTLSQETNKFSSSEFSDVGSITSSDSGRRYSLDSSSLKHHSRSKCATFKTNKNSNKTINNESDYVKEPGRVNKEEINNKIKELQRLKKEIEREYIKKLKKLKKEFGKLDNDSRYSLKWFKKLIEAEIEISKSRFANKSLKITFYKVKKISNHLLELSSSDKPVPQFIEDFPNIRIYDENNNQIEYSAISVNKNKVKIKVKSINKKPKKVTIEVKNLSFLLETLKEKFDSLQCNIKIKEEIEEILDKIKIIYGPPGTGKTTKIVEDILKIDDLNNKKILFLAPTNKAVDVFVRKIKDVVDGKIEHLKQYNHIARELIDNKLIVRYKSTSDENIEKLTNEEINNACIVATTIAKISYDEKLYNYSPNILIFDECSMIPLPYIIYAILKLKDNLENIWISGDPNQIQPVGFFEYWEKYNIYEMFNDLLNINLYDIEEDYSNYFKEGYYKLKTQYRSIKSIGELFSEYTYHGILKHHRENEKPDYLSELFNSNICVIEYEVNNSEKSKKVYKIENSPINIYSAILSSELALKIIEILKKKKEKKSIGIISPYKYQSQLIESLILNQIGDDDIEVYASTVHKFQGEECDIIIVVLNPPNINGVSDKSLLNNKNLLNVAISRAKDYLFILLPKGLNNIAENLRDLYDILEKDLEVTKLDGKSLENILFKNSSLKESVFITTHSKINAYGKNIGVKYELKLDEESSNELNSIDVFVNKGFAHPQL